MKSPTNRKRLLENVDRFIRDKFTYSDEKIETLQHPDYMLKGLEVYNRLIGDCDDITMLHAALLIALGFQVHFVAIRDKHEDPNFNHVYLETENNGDWIMYDITLPLGTQVEYFGRIAVMV